MGRDRKDLSVSSILIDTNGKIVLQLRDNTEDIPFPDHWGFISGWVQHSESTFHAITREIEEELLCWNGDVVKILSIEHIGQQERSQNHTEHVYITIIEASEKYQITEGQSAAAFSYEDVFKLEKFAKHHQEYYTLYKTELERALDIGK